MGFSQSFQDSLQINEEVIKPHKNREIEHTVSFKSNLKEKYSDKEFVYIDDLKEPKKEEASPPTNNGFLVVFLAFMSYVFPFVLGIIIVLIILKIVLGTDMGFWNLKKSSRKAADKLVYEEENIHDTDFNKLLEKAIRDTDFRLATRYYYLSLLKKLSDLKTIEYHKDKTNTDYVFEIENKDLRNQFSELSYIYSYVWYGEFSVDTDTFKTIENKYKSVFKFIH